MLPRLMRPFLGYWYHSAPDRYAAIARKYARLIAHCVDDHMALADAAGARHLLRPGGWTMAHETPAALGRRRGQRGDRAARLRRGVSGARCGGAGARGAASAQRPLAGGLQWTQPVAVIDPHALTVAYAALFERLGGRVRIGDARTLAPYGCRLAGDLPTAGPGDGGGGGGGARRVVAPW